MIILRDKTFASKATIAGRPEKCAATQCAGVLIELIKVIEFYYHQNNMKHWLLEEIVGRYFSEAVNAHTLITDCLIRGDEGATVVKRIGNKLTTGDEFVEGVFDLFKPGKEQYRKYAPSYKTELDNMKFDVQFYRDVLKYISLVFTGQIEDPSSVDLWEVSRMRVDYDSTHKRNTVVNDETRRLLLECIVKIMGGYKTPEMIRLLRDY